MEPLCRAVSHRAMQAKGGNDAGAMIDRLPKWAADPAGKAAQVHFGFSRKLCVDACHWVAFHPSHSPEKPATCLNRSIHSPGSTEKMDSRVKNETCASGSLLLQRLLFFTFFAQNSVFRFVMTDDDVLLGGIVGASLAPMPPLTVLPSEKVRHGMPPFFWVAYEYDQPARNRETSPHTSCATGRVIQREQNVCLSSTTK